MAKVTAACLQVSTINTQNKNKDRDKFYILKNNSCSIAVTHILIKHVPIYTHAKKFGWEEGLCSCYQDYLWVCSENHC
jgi:hypothetical protein